MAIVLGPAIDRFQAGRTLSRWWFLRKHPDRRIRLLDADTDMVSNLLDKLLAAGTVAAWRPALYESEAAAFGGRAGMTVHRAVTETG